MDSSFPEEIKQNLKNSLRKYVSHFKYKKIQPLDLLIPKERKIRSVVGGLETSMGTTVWEPVAKTLAGLNHFEIIEDKILRPDPFPRELANELSVLITLRENKKTWISTEKCINRIRDVCRKINKDKIKYVLPAAGTGVDIRLRKQGKEYAFDTKTVQPNLGSIKSFNKQLLEWYAYLLCEDPDLDIYCKIAYPYNPYKNDFWLHPPHNRDILEPHVDAIVGNEFWDFLSGLTNTYELIIGIFIELHKEGFGQELSELIERIHTPQTSKNINTL